MEGSSSTAVGFFQIGSGRGISRALTRQDGEGFKFEYDAMFYVRPASDPPLNEGDLFAYRGIRYRVRNRNPVYFDSSTIDHIEYFLEREEGTD